MIEYGSMKPSLREGGGDLASALHMSEAKRNLIHAEVITVHITYTSF